MSQCSRGFLYKCYSKKIPMFKLGNNFNTIKKNMYEGANVRSRQLLVAVHFLSYQAHDD